MTRHRPADDRWYQRAVFYEVLVRGFYDPTADGTGDLKGPHREARLPASGSASTASGCCPSTSRRCATAATTSATSSPCCPSTATSTTPRADRGGAPPRHPGHRRHGDEPHQRPAPVVPGVPPGRAPTPRPTGTSGATTTSAGPRRGSSSSTPSRRTGRGTRSASSTTGTASSTISPTSTTTTPRSRRRCSTSFASGSTSASTASGSTRCPYLFERDGTNGENLPETHEYLRRVRKVVDDEYPGRVLLAEANQWPDDVVDYFGPTATSATCASTSR